MLRTIVGGGSVSDGGHRMPAFVLSHFLHPFRSLPLSDTEMQKDWSKPNKECDNRPLGERARCFIQTWKSRDGDALAQPQTCSAMRTCAAGLIPLLFG